MIVEETQTYSLNDCFPVFTGYSEPRECGHPVLQMFCSGMDYVPINIAVHYNPLNADTPLFCKTDRFFGPTHI